MGLFLAIVGLLLTAIDFFDLTHRAEAFAVGLRNRLTIANNRRYAFNEGIEKRFPLVKWFALPELIFIVGLCLTFLLGGTGNPVALTIGAIVFIGYFLYKGGVYILAYSVLFLHALSVPKKGIVATLGLVLAVIGVWIEFSK
jgi:hypothetical protein